jgi:4-aminobutyrate aminotransferase
MKNYPFTNIKTRLPGPKSARIMKMDEQSVSPSYVRTKPFVTEKGVGVILTDVDGNQFLDFCAGIAVCSTGHCHPEIVSTIQKQAGKLIHTAGAIFAHEPLSLLAKKSGIDYSRQIKKEGLFFELRHRGN